MAINTLFENIADAIREKAGTSGLINPAQMPAAIAAIPSGATILEGTAIPSDSLGENGDFYFRYRQIDYVDSGLGWSADSSYMVNNANTLLATMSGREFYKKNTGYAFGAFCQFNNYSGPLLCSTVSDNVKLTYNDSNTNGPYTYNGLNFYISTDGYWMGGQPASTAGVLPTLRIQRNSSANLQTITDIAEAASVSIPAISGATKIVIDIYYKVNGAWMLSDFAI